MATTTPRSSVRPAKDEWGVYDPQQAGLAAVFARLDSKTAPVSTEAKADNATMAMPPLPRPTLRDAK